MGAGCSVKVAVAVEHHAWLLLERQFEKALMELGWEKVPNWECLFVHRKQKLFLSVYVDDIKMAGAEFSSYVEELDERR